MSRLIFGCPNCVQAFQVEATQAGQQVRCPGCETVVEIPSQSMDHSIPIAQSAVDRSPSEQPVEELPRDGSVSPQKSDLIQSPPSLEAPPTPTSISFDCPHCRSVFGVLDSMFGTTMACPHCDQAVAIPLDPTVTGDAYVAIEKTSTTPTTTAVESEEQKKPEETPEEREAPAPITIRTSSDAQLDADSTAAPREPTDAAEEELGVAAVEFVPHDVDHLLPPRFEALDPTFFYRQRGRTGHDQVLLPQADGTVVAVSNRIVTVVHDGIEYQLTSSPRYKRNMSLVVNTILIAIAIMLVFAIYFVVK